MRWIVGGLLALTALVGVAHTPIGRPLLAWMARTAGCPFPTARREVDATEAEALRRAVVERGRGDKAAAARPALGFSLGETTPLDVAAWAKTHGITCASDRSGAGLRCDAVRGEALPAPIGTAMTGELRVGFTPAGRLSGLQWQVRAGTLEDASWLVRKAESLLAAAGPASERRDADLSQTFLQKRVRFAYADFVGEAVATNLGDGFLVWFDAQAL
jgi:hypothetical protein